MFNGNFLMFKTEKSRALSPVPQAAQDFEYLVAFKSIIVRKSEGIGVRNETELLPFKYLIQKNCFLHSEQRYFFRFFRNMLSHSLPFSQIGPSHFILYP